MANEPDVRAYAEELHAMLRLRSPDAYRVFLAKWRGLLERGVADRLIAQSDAALRLRIERMILDLPALADVHDSATEYLAAHGRPGRQATPTDERR
jgi:hypothetical protein